MNEEVYTAMRAYIRAAVELENEKSRDKLRDELRAELLLEIRAAPPLATLDPPAAGKDGVGIAEVRTVNGDLTIRLTDGSEHNAGRIVGEKGERGADGVGAPGERGTDGQPGQPGERGADGVASEERIRSIAAEEVRDAAALQMRDFYQGVFRPDTEYRTGQAATWDGSMWVATRDTASKPGTDDSWLLAVKRGRDAKR